MWLTIFKKPRRVGHIKEVLVNIQLKNYHLEIFFIAFLNYIAEIIRTVHFNAFD